MPLHRPRLLSHEGYLYIVHEYAKDDPPGGVDIIFYPIGMRTRDYEYNWLTTALGSEKFPEEGWPAREAAAPGEYVVERPRPLPEQRFRLQRGGQTTPAFVKQRVIPPPKVRPGVELRWSGGYGRWEKASKSTKWKWVAAGEGKPPKQRKRKTKAKRENGRKREPTKRRARVGTKRERSQRATLNAALRRDV